VIKLQTFCTFVYDGDTIAIDPKTGYKWVRLVSIDAPEIKQQLGLESKQSLMNFCHKRAVNLNIVTVDKYGRLIAQVIVDGMDASVYQARMGMAFPYFLHDCNKERVLMASAQAKQSRLGVWGIENFVLPSKLRRDPIHLYKASNNIPNVDTETADKTFTANTKVVEAVEAKPDEREVDQLLLSNRRVFMPTLMPAVWVEQVIRRL
jgi:hypothetical protein